MLFRLHESDFLMLLIDSAKGIITDFCTDNLRDVSIFQVLLTKLSHRNENKLIKDDYSCCLISYSLININMHKHLNMPVGVHSHTHACTHIHTHTHTYAQSNTKIHTYAKHAENNFKEE